ncbi:MAG: cytochrome c biogenesis protein CcsA [Deltaproteobacteria bacterium]|nr:cytochrome c biogenesis protein CcsA [Deltaproteobacteria bacterium]
MYQSLLQATAGFYLLATGAFILHLFFQREAFSRAGQWLLLAGFVGHAVKFAFLFHDAGFPALAQTAATHSFYGWLMVGVYLTVQLKYRLPILGGFVAPLAFLMSLRSIALGEPGLETPPALLTYWLPLHVTLALLGNAVFALAFAVSVVYLVVRRQLKQKRMTGLSRTVPALETLDRLNKIFLVWGFPFMTLGILTGSVWAHAQWGNFWSWDPRQITSALTWLLYGILLHGRLTAGWRGRKAALWTIAGFLIVLGYFLGGDAFFLSRHGGRFE